MKRHIWILTCCAWIAACTEAEEIEAGCLAQLSEGTTVELVGIRPYGGGHPQRTRDKSGPWWSPDGTPLAAPPDGRVDSCSWRDSYLFVVAVEGKTDCDFKAIGPWDYDLTVQPTREFEKGKGLEDKDLRRFTLRAGNQKSLDIRLGVATGEWKTTDRWTIDPDWTPYNLILSSVEKIILRCPEQKGRDVVAEVTQIITERATRLVLFDKDDNRYESEGEIQGEGDGLVRRVHRFKKLDRSNIKHIEFQAREYDYWVTFHNVSLEMGHKTQVQADVKKPGDLLRGNALPGFDDIQLDFAPENDEGRMLLVCFFDMDQRPSRHCIRQLSTRARELEDAGVAVIAVQASKIDNEKLDNWVKENNMPFPVGTIGGDAQKIRFTWGVRSLPWLILANDKHLVVSKGSGLEELQDELRKMGDK